MRRRLTGQATGTRQAPDARLSRSDFLRLGGLLGAASVLPAGLASCSAFVGGGEESGTKEEGRTRRLRMFLTSEQRSAIEPLVRTYEKDEDVTASSTFAQTDELNAQLRTQLSAGTAPDLFRTAPGSGAPTAVQLIAPDGYLADLSDAAWVPKVPKALAPLCSVDGKVYAYPLNRSVIATFYNKRVFSDLGVSPPRTWSEFLRVCGTIKKAGTTPLALGLAEATNVQLTTYALAATSVFARDPDFTAQLRDGRATFAESAGWRESLEKFLELARRGYTTENALGTPFDQAMRSVAKGEAAMMTMVSASVPQMAAYAEQGVKAFGVFATPAGDDPEETIVPASPDFLSVNAKAKNPEAAKGFLDFLAEAGNVNAYAEASTCLPGLDIDDPRPSELLAPVASYLEAGRTVPYMNHLWPNAEVQQVLFQAGQQLFASEASVADVLAAMDEAYAKGGR